MSSYTTNTLPAYVPKYVTHKLISLIIVILRPFYLPNC